MDHVSAANGSIAILEFDNQPRTTRDELVNDLKRAGTTVTKATFCNTLRRHGLKRTEGSPDDVSLCQGPSEVWQ